tara:strand:+ start:817 stop:1275 length:459 start_codon:yes stop_codon:yes gene_type:complete
MWDVIGSVMTGGATGILGSVLGKLFNFADVYIEEKKAKGEHERTMEMHRLQAELRADELENERAIVEEQSAGAARVAAYSMMTGVEVPYPWVAAILRLIRPVLTIMLVAIVWYIYASSDDIAQQETIIQSVIFMASTAVLFWFGDRAMRPKK